MTALTDDIQNKLPLLEILSESLMDAVYLIDPISSNILWVNREGYESLQMRKEELLNHSVLSLQKDVVGPQQWQSIAAVIRENKKFTFIGHHLRKDNTELPVEVNTSVLTYQGEEFFLSIARDISSRRAQEAENQSREKQIWFALNACTDGLWDWELASGNVYFSPRLKNMLGYGPEEMSPEVETWKNNIHPDDLAMVIQSLEGHIEGQRQRYEAVYRLKNRNGHYIWVHDLGSVSERAENGSPARVTGMVKDITDYKQQEFRLQELAAYDELTKLRNRRECTRIFEKQLALAKRHQQPLSICLFDFDLFKKINDKYGHLGGDFVLKETAEFLTENLRKSDFLFRWGGEEFILICINTTQEEMQILTEELRFKLENHRMKYLEHSLSITGSFGLATYPQHAETQADLVLAADSALYSAKSNGRNCVYTADQ